MLPFYDELNASFNDKYCAIFEASFKNFNFLTHFVKNYAIFEISTKKENNL